MSLPTEHESLRTTLLEAVIAKNYPEDAERIVDGLMRLIETEKTEAYRQGGIDELVSLETKLCGHYSTQPGNECVRQKDLYDRIETLRERAEASYGSKAGE